MGGFFGFFDYSKAGKGVRKDEPKRSHFAQFWILTQRKFWQIMQLNLLFLLFCVPIVTIGPAMAGMTYVLRQFAAENPVFLLSDFWDNFKSNFKQSFAFGLLQTVFAIIIAYSVQFYFINAPQNMWMYLTLGFSIMVTLLAIFASFYVYLMIVTLDLKLIAIIKNSLIFAVLCMRTNFITLFFLIVVYGVTFIFFPMSMLLVLTILFSFTNFIICYNSYPHIRKYAIEPYLESLREQADAESGAEPQSDESENENVFSDEFKKSPWDKDQ